MGDWLCKVGWSVLVWVIRDFHPFAQHCIARHRQRRGMNDEFDPDLGTVFYQQDS